MEKIQISARFKIHPGKAEAFKKVVATCVVIVSEKEKGKTCSQYDWFFSSDNSESVVRETYNDSDAVLLHLGNVGEQLGQLLEMADFSAEFYGPISDELKNAVAPFKPALYSFYSGL